MANWKERAKEKFKKVKKAYTKYRKDAPKREEAELKRIESQTRLETARGKLRKARSTHRPKSSRSGMGGGGGDIFSLRPSSNGMMSGSRDGTGPTMSGPRSYSTAPSYYDKPKPPTTRRKPKPKRKPTRRKPRKRRRR